MKVLAVAGVLILAALAAPSVQAADIKAAIPFEFAVSEQTLPAGEYTVRRVASSPGILLLQGTDMKTAVFITTIGVQSTKSSEPAKFVFRRYGDRHVLRQVWMGSDNLGRELLKSKLELEIARGVSPAKEKVAIAATTR